MSDNEVFRASLLRALGGYRCAQSLLVTHWGLNDQSVMAMAALDGLDLRLAKCLVNLGGLAGEW